MPDLIQSPAQLARAKRLTQAARAYRLNRPARALAEAEALGIDLRDPFGALSPEAEDSLDRLIYGRAWEGLI